MGASLGEESECVLFYARRDYSRLVGMAIKGGGKGGGGKKKKRAREDALSVMQYCEEARCRRAALLSRCC